MDIIHDAHSEITTENRQAEAEGIQAGAYLLELSADWIVLRASENVHHLLGESHVTLIDEPLGRFVHAEALHDLRNLFSRLSGTTGIARAYQIRLTDDPDRFDIAFQLVDGRVLLEAIRSPERGIGQTFGTVGGLIAGLEGSQGQGLLDGGARRMRALTGYDRVTMNFGDRVAESSRGALLMNAHDVKGSPALVGDTGAALVPIFPRKLDDTSADAALLRAPGHASRLRDAGVRAMMRVPFSVKGEKGEFVCESGSPRAPSMEVHAAAELFAQLFAVRLEIDQLKKG